MNTSFASLTMLLFLLSGLDMDCINSMVTFRALGQWLLLEAILPNVHLTLLESSDLWPKSLSAVAIFL